MTTVRKNKGRQKIQMAKMTNESNLQVTFSKRRSGLFKKASEICTLCGAEVAIIVFSPGEKVFSFGHPNVEAVIDRFFTGDPMPTNPEQASSLLEAHRNANILELNMELTQVLEQLEGEKKLSEMMNKMTTINSRMRYWWERPVEELDEDQLRRLKEALEDVKKNAKIQIDKVLIEGSSSNPFFGDQHRILGHGSETYGEEYGHVSTNDNVHQFGYGGRRFL